jgi:hypothetical protein
VFLQYDWLELVRPHRDWLELFFWKDLIDPWELDLDAKSFLYYSLIYKVLLPMAPYTSSFNMISTCKFNKNHPRFGRAFIPKYGQISLSEQQLLKRIKTQFGDGSNPVLMNRLELTHFFKMLELLKQHKVRTCLIKYPLGKPYYHAVSSLSGFEAYEDTLEMVKKAYDIEVLDYSRLFFDLPCDNYNCQRLHDFDHVDAEGADIVSRLVGSNLL